MATRFNQIELDKIEKELWRLRKPTKEFFERLEATYDDALKAELYGRVAQVRRIFMATVPEEYLTSETKPDLLLPPQVH